MNDKYLYDKDGKFLGKISDTPPRPHYHVNDEILANKTIESMSMWLYGGAIAILIFFAPGALIIHLLKIPRNSTAEWVVGIGASLVFWGPIIWWAIWYHRPRN